MKLNTSSFLTVFILFVACNKVSEHNDCYENSKKPSQIITYEEMASMTDAYNNGAKPILDTYMAEVSNGKDTISTEYNWYRIEDLKQYIAYIERISKEKDIPVTGFRIRPSAYPKDYSVKELQNRLTLIFTPTTKIGDRDDVAFEPLYSERGKPMPIDTFIKQVGEKHIDEAAIFSLKTQEGLESSSANRIRTYPPF